MDRNSESNNGVVSLNELKLMWIKARLKVLTEEVRRSGRRPHGEVGGPGGPTKRKVRAIDRGLTVLEKALDELEADVQSGRGQRPARWSDWRRLQVGG
jgi:hypothetical protein